MLRRTIPLSCLLSALMLVAPSARSQPQPPPEETQPPADAPPADAPEATEPPADGEPTEGDEELVEDEETDPGRPAPAGKGVVWGTLLDAKTGEPLIEAQITAVGKDQQSFTDYDGHYRLELPPGRYDLRFWYELRQATVLSGVQVVSGQVQQIDEKLAAEEGAVEVFAVETEADTASIEGQLLTRKRASGVGDSIGRAEMAKTPDKDAAAAARRVVGATVADGRFVYVRGLGERYTNALLDGAPLPSPEPDRQTVPLDLFPSKMLDSLSIVKTFTPQMPGDFAGGSVQIETRRMPDEFTFLAGASIGFNSQTTFGDFLQYGGSSTDWLGIDGGTRALPGSIPDYKVGRGLPKPDGSLITAPELAGWGNDINAYMSTRRQMAPPNHAFDVVVGDTFDLGGTHKLGVMGAATYGRTFTNIDDERRRTVRQGPDGLVEQNDVSIERGLDAVRWGGLAGLTWEINPHHHIYLTGLHSRSSDDEARELEGLHAERQATLHETRLEFVSRSLTFGQLRGEHEIADLGDARIGWNASLALATRDQPDTRATVFEYSSGFGYRFEDDSFSGMHFFSTQEERTIGAGLDWTQPLRQGDDPVELSFGALVNLRARQFSARRFRFRPSNSQASGQLICDVDPFDSSCSDQIFAAGNIGTLLTLEENTRATDAYDTDLNVYAGYLMVDAHLTDDLRIIAGPRLEMSRMTLEAYDPSGAQPDRLTTELDGEDLLPGASLVWSFVEDMNLRLAGSRTVARPQLLELAPFSFTNYFGGYTEAGNPDLENTRIYNGDLRWEWFPTPREVLAASLFAKHFELPIEQVLRPDSGNGLITYQNADGADLVGGELEVRKSFDFVTPVLSDLSLIANLTLAFSRVNIDETDFGAANLTSTERPLTNQAPWVVNLALDYDDEEVGAAARVLYNVAGRRIVTVGQAPLPDIYEQPRHVIDVAVAQRIFEGFRIKGSVKNLINAEHLFTFGAEDKGEETLQRSYREGISFSIGASYSL